MSYTDQDLAEMDAYHDRLDKEYRESLSPEQLRAYRLWDQEIIEVCPNCGVEDAEIDPTELKPMHRELNKSLMVAWINRDLLNRSHHDVRRSVVLYDADKDFVHAMDEVPDEDLLHRLYEATPVRYYSAKGI